MFYMFYFAAEGAEIAATSHSCSVRLHLNLPAQPRLKLLTDDPHTAVSVAEAAFKRILQLGTFRFECSRWQHTEQPDWGGKELKLPLHQVLFLALDGAARQNFSLSLDPEKTPARNLSNCLRLWADRCRGLFTVVRRCNSPGSCCPAGLWWGCCWGWKTGRGPPWCGGPPRVLEKTNRDGNAGVWETTETGQQLNR